MCKLQGSETISRTQLKSVWEPHLLCPTNMYVSALTCFCILEWTQLSETELSYCKVDLCLSSSLHAAYTAPSTNLVDKLDIGFYFTFISYLNCSELCFCFWFGVPVEDYSLCGWLVHKPNMTFSSKEDYCSMWFLMGYFFFMDQMASYSDVFFWVFFAVGIRIHPSGP